MSRSHSSSLVNFLSIKYAITEITIKAGISIIKTKNIDMPKSNIKGINGRPSQRSRLMMLRRTGMAKSLNFAGTFFSDIFVKFSYFVGNTISIIPDKLNITIIAAIQGMNFFTIPGSPRFMIIPTPRPPKAIPQMAFM
jgi:hypothetical protein